VPLAKRNGVGKDYVEKARKVRAHEAMHTSRGPPKWTPRAKTTHGNSARGCVRAGVPLIPPKVARPYASPKSPRVCMTPPVNMPPQGFLHTSRFPELIRNPARLRPPRELLLVQPVAIHPCRPDYCCEPIEHTRPGTTGISTPCAGQAKTLLDMLKTVRRCCAPRESISGE